MSKNKVFFAIVFSALTSFNIKAQEFTDIGLFAGSSYYMGDLNTAMHYQKPAFAVGPVFRYNFNNYTALRAHAFYHSLSGEGLIPGGKKPYFQSNFVDLGLDFEFNWKAYRTAHRKTKASPYVFAGLGYSLQLGGGLIYENSSIPITIPFGFGYKINLGKWLSGGIEVSGRKVFSDEIDGVRNPGFDQGGQSAQGVMTPFGNRDWIFFTGVFFTYKFFKFWEDCPTYDNSHKY